MNRRKMLVVFTHGTFSWDRAQAIMKNPSRVNVHADGSGTKRERCGWDKDHLVHSSAEAGQDLAGAALRRPLHAGSC